MKNETRNEKRNEMIENLANNKQKISKQLSKCPFCGGEAVTIESYNKKVDKYLPAVRCLNCGCRTTTYISEVDAITAWNTRKPVERILEMLEERHKGHEEFIKDYKESKNCEAALKQIERRTENQIAIEIVKGEGGIDGIHVQEI